MVSAARTLIPMRNLNKVLAFLHVIVERKNSDLRARDIVIQAAES